MIEYSAVSELEVMIVGDWLRCSGVAYPAEHGEGIRIYADH